MTQELLEQLAPGQIWMVDRTIRRAGEDRTAHTHMIVLVAAHPDWIDRPGLHRSHLRHGDLSKYTPEQALDNMEYLYTTPLRKTDWSPWLLHYGPKRLRYREMIGQL